MRVFSTFSCSFFSAMCCLWRVLASMTDLSLVWQLKQRPRQEQRRTHSSYPLAGSASSFFFELAWHGMMEGESSLFLLSTSPVFVGSCGPILPIVFFAEFSSEITVFVFFHLDEAFLFHVAVDLFSHLTTDP